MVLIVVGVNHQTPLEIREKISLTQRQIMTKSEDVLTAGFTEVMILSTCNRTEIYALSPHQENLGNLGKLLIQEMGFGDYQEHFYVYQQSACARHLFEVAAGLDSLVLGEDQILGQIKLAHGLALDLGTSKKVLNRLFQTAVEVAKEIKSTTKLSENSLSLSKIAVNFLKEELGGLKGKRGMLVGAGEMGRLCVNYLVDELDVLYIASRNIEKTKEQFAGSDALVHISYEKRYAYLQAVDFVICATTAPHFIFERRLWPVDGGLKVMIDMGMPRDVDVHIGDVNGVDLFNLDEFAKIKAENMAFRQKVIEDALPLIQKGVDGFYFWYERMGVDGVISGLNEKCLDIHGASMAFLAKKIDVDKKTMQMIETVMLNGMKQLIRAPIVALKEENDELLRQQKSQCLSDLFGLKFEE